MGLRRAFIATVRVRTLPLMVLPFEVNSPMTAIVVILSG
jgi:hypothetical protein